MSTNDVEVEKAVLEFIKNRAGQNESTASRHIHRRFDIAMKDADKILAELSKKKIIEIVYDEEYQEIRYTWKK